MARLLLVCSIMIVSICHVVTELSQEIDIIVHTIESGREKRSGDGLPDDLDIDIPVGSDTARLHLHRNTKVGARVPITVERRGRIVYQNVPLSHTVGYYQDVTRGSAFMVDSNQDGGGQPYSFFGEIFQDNKTYLVQPPDPTHQHHTLTEIVEERPVVNDFVLPPDTATDDETVEYPESTGRSRRTVVYAVEVLMVADYKVYSYWFDRSTSDTAVAKDLDAKAKMEQYYAFLINAIDLRYKSVTAYTIDILFAGLHIADTAAGAPWTEDIKVTTVTPTQVDSSAGLAAFREWIVVQSDLPGFDHAMLFTGYDLTSKGNKDVAGMAYRGGLCGVNRVSINEYDLAASMATIAAHELGHNLGSRHDSNNNTCPETGYIMGAKIRTTNDDFDYNYHQHRTFSSCTVAYFDDNIGNFPCLTSTASSYDPDALAAYENDAAGQIYPPDVQCQEIVASDSFLFRRAYNGDFSVICNMMYCATAGNTGYYTAKIPWDGTTCGNGKICIGGECVASALAPTELTETCLFGDQPLPVLHNNKLCSAQTSKDCVTYATYCCESCGTIAQQSAGLTDKGVPTVMLLEPIGMRLGGVAKSHGDIDYSLFLGQLTPSKECYVEVGRELDLHPAILAAIVSRESNFGYSIQNNGWGYGEREARRYGLMQCDIVYDPVKIFSQGQYDCQSYSWDSCEHVKMVARYALIPMISDMTRKFPDWTSAQHIQGGVAAYMLAAGADSVISWDDVDRFTTGHDYSNDVIARAQYIVKKERWDDGSNINGDDGPVMDDALISRLKTDLIFDEGLKYHIYNDSVGKLSFGIGHLIKKTDPEYGKPINTPVSKDRVDESFEADVTIAISDCVKLHADFAKLPDEAKLVIANMMFNLGYTKLSKFAKFKAAVVKRDWNTAADEMKDSKWYGQVTNRAERLIKRIRAL